MQESRRKLGSGSAVRPGDDDGLEGPWNIPLCITRPRFAFGWLEAGSLGRAVRQAKGSWARHAPRGRCRIGRRRRANCSCGLAPMCERRGLAADVMFEVLTEAAWLLHWAPGKMTPRDAGRCDTYEYRTARPVERAAC